MTGYYAFSWRRFYHSLHPMTPATILETGFLTNQRDEKLLTRDASKIPAGALADALLQFLNLT
jgi:N-acetylmuramoyl-L-alanine amidase